MSVPFLHILVQKTVTTLDVKWLECWQTSGYVYIYIICPIPKIICSKLFIKKKKKGKTFVSVSFYFCGVCQQKKRTYRDTHILCPSYIVRRGPSSFRFLFDFIFSFGCRYERFSTVRGCWPMALSNDICKTKKRHVVQWPQMEPHYASDIIHYVVRIPYKWHALFEMKYFQTLE